MNVSLIGPVCAGKGTYARELCPRFGLVHVATGDLLRLAGEAGTPAARLAQTHMERGDLAPDEIVLTMVEDWVALRGADGILFDGFPRTVEQARFIDELLAESKRELDMVVALEVGYDEILERLAGRLTCEVCQSTFHQAYRPPHKADVCDVCGGDLYRRADDDPVIVRSRLQTFRRTITPLLRHYRAHDRLAIVDATGTIDDVYEQIAGLVEAVGRGETPFTLLLERVEQVPEERHAEPTRATNDVVLLGGPGSGKGTQAEKLAKVLGVPHISTGELFRESVEDGTSLGKLAQSYMQHGELVPDDITEAMVRDRLARDDATDGFILDGYPRSPAQAEALDEILGELGRTLAAAVFIEVSDDEIAQRLAGRGRNDDDPETVKTRLRSFHRHITPVLEHYRDRGILHEIDGEGSPEEVNERARAELQQE